MLAKMLLQVPSGYSTKFPFLFLSFHPCLALNVGVTRPWVSSGCKDTACVREWSRAGI